MGDTVEEAAENFGMECEIEQLDNNNAINERDNIELGTPARTLLNWKMEEARQRLPYSALNDEEVIHKSVLDLADRCYANNEILDSIVDIQKEGEET